MKKLVVTILAFIYLLASAGATVHLHYCMDKLVDSKLWHNEEKKCGNCGMDKSQEKKDGCCKDEHKQLKVDNDHKGSAGLQMTEWTTTVPVSFFELPNISLSTVTEQHPLSHAPPRCGDLAVYKRNCVFRI